MAIDAMKQPPNSRTRPNTCPHLCQLSEISSGHRHQGTPQPQVIFFVGCSTLQLARLRRSVYTMSVVTVAAMYVPTKRICPHAGRRASRVPGGSCPSEPQAKIPPPRGGGGPSKAHQAHPRAGQGRRVGLRTPVREGSRRGTREYARRQGATGASCETAASYRRCVTEGSLPPRTPEKNIFAFFKSCRQAADPFPPFHRSCERGAAWRHRRVCGGMGGG